MAAHPVGLVIRQTNHRYQKMASPLEGFVNTVRTLSQQGKLIVFNVDGYLLLLGKCSRTIYDVIASVRTVPSLEITSIQDCIFRTMVKGGSADLRICGYGNG